jgi:hypothetical protein
MLWRRHACFDRLLAVIRATTPSLPRGGRGGLDRHQKVKLKTGAGGLHVSD